MRAEKEVNSGRAGHSNSCNRRSNKPLMEKRRRARINQSLAELKNLIIDAFVKKEQTSRSSKLEKADILEMTVRHVQSLQRQRSTETADCAVTKSESVKYQAGFKECQREVAQFMDSVDGFDIQLRRRLANHLLTRLSQLQSKERTDRPVDGGGAVSSAENSEAESGHDSNSVSSAKAETSSTSKSEISVVQSNSVVSGAGVHLIPTRLLPTGEIAFLWPFTSGGQPQSDSNQTVQSTKPVAATSSAASWCADVTGNRMLDYYGGWLLPANPSSAHRLKEEAMWRPW